MRKEFIFNNTLSKNNPDPGGFRRDGLGKFGREHMCVDVGGMGPKVLLFH
jgi:hypothetical protein